MNMNIKKNNKGFTLLEMVLTVALISILIGGVAVVFPQWLSQYILLKQTAAATEVMDVIASGIEDEMAFSRNRMWGPSGVSYVTGDRVCTLPLKNSQAETSYADGRLVINGRPRIYGAIFDTAFYKDMTVQLTMWESKRERDGMPILMIQVEVYSDQGILLCSETKPTAYYNP